MIFYGIDVHDKRSNYFALDGDGEELGTGSLPTTPETFQRFFKKEEPAKIAIEAGAHSHWIADSLEKLGHTVVVANPRRVRLIAENREKDDQIDAEFLARLLRTDPKLLAPTYVRDENNLFSKAYLKVRGTYAKTRTMLINTARGIVKPFGCKLPKCDTDNFSQKIRDLNLPDRIVTILGPILVQIQHFTDQIKAFDKELAEISKGNETQARFQEIPGIGPIISMAYIQHIGDPNRFKNSEAVGKYLGLTAGRRFSGGGGFETSIIKTGDTYMRSLMTQAAQGFLRVKKDSDLKRWADDLLKRLGEKRGKKKVIIALARKLAVLLHRLWVRGEKYEPFNHSKTRKKSQTEQKPCLPLSHCEA